MSKARIDSKRILKGKNYKIKILLFYNSIVVLKPQKKILQKSKIKGLV